MHSDSEDTDSHSLIEKISARFERACCDGESPLIETWLDEVDSSQRSALFAELLAVELRCSDDSFAGGGIERFRERFPEMESQIVQVFGASDIHSTLARPASDRSSGEDLLSLATQFEGSREGAADSQNESSARRAPSGVEDHRGRSRYRVVREHARGGIGEVFVAEDQELPREVALKELQSAQSEIQDCRERFVLEAEITGQLEHPGIVPVYGMGRYEDGRPFYAMRFIRGESLQDAITSFHENAGRRGASDRRLHLTELLRRFVDVCNAIEYAHSRGVIHRDLKPANVMLGDYGETLVVDWGLARTGESNETLAAESKSPVHVRSGSLSAPTQMGSVFGTPAYMAPEQAAGEMHRVGPLSDVYSLGATLYHLLAGRPPFVERDVRSLLGKVMKGAYRSPREIQPTVARSLDAICCKAMSLRPEDRYEGAMEIAKDVKRWISDEPVSAHREPFFDRARRWTRSHRTLVTSAGATLLVTLLCLGVGLVLLNASRNRESQAKQLAEANHLAAEANFAKAKAAVDDFYTRISEEVLFNEPGLQPVRRDLLTKALTYYEGFVEERAGDPELQRDVAIGWYRVGAITEEIASLDVAMQAYERANELQREILRAAPESVERRAELSDIVSAIGRVHQRMGNVEAARQCFRESLGLRVANVDARPDDIELQRKYASNIMNLGVADRLSGDVESGYERLLKAQALREKFQSDDSPKLIRDLGMGAYNLGVFYLEDKQEEAGNASLQDAIDAFEHVLSLTPRDAATEQRLSKAYRLLADHFVAQEEYDIAIEYYEQAGAIMDSLSIRNPDVPEFRSSLASAYMNIANARRFGGDLLGAVDGLSMSIDLLTEIVYTSSVPQHRRDLCVAYHTLAAIEVEQGHLESAERHAKSALELIEPLVEESPANSDFQLQKRLIEQVFRSLNTPT